MSCLKDHGRLLFVRSDLKMHRFPVAGLESLTFFMHRAYYWPSPYAPYLAAVLPCLLAQNPKL